MACRPRGADGSMPCWAMSLLMMAAVTGCERPDFEMWVPGEKPTAYSGLLEGVDGGVAETPGSTRHGAPGSQISSEDQPSQGDAKILEGQTLAPLKEQLRLLRVAMQSDNQESVDAVVQTTSAMDRATVGRLLISILKSNDEELRVAAARLIGLLKVREGLRTLFDRLVTEDIFLAQAAAMALGDLGDPSAVSFLVDQSKRHASASVRSTALNALGKLGDKKSLAGVVECTRDSDPSVREAAAHVLGKLGNLAEHQPVLKELQKDATSTVRLSAVLALAELHAPEALESMVDLLADPSEEVRRSAESALVSYPDRLMARSKLLDAIEQKDPSALLSFSQAFKSLCDCSCIPDLERVLSRTEKLVVKNAVEALIQQIGAGCSGTNP
jgi:hypothetical protein